MSVKSIVEVKEEPKFKIKAPKFTPGPWVALGTTIVSDKSHTHVDGEESTPVIAKCQASGHFRHKWPKGMPEANAHLIATAPEMFDLLCAIHMFLENVVCGEARSDIEKVIKKARGES